MLVRSLFLAVAVAVATPATAGQWDGTWTGTAGNWNVNIVVKGAQGRIRATCEGADTGAIFGEVLINPDGSFRAFVSGGRMVAREVKGILPALSVSDLGICRGGAAVLHRAEI